MKTKLQKIVIHMSRFGVYVFLALQSLSMVMASGVGAQQKMLDEIYIDLELSKRSISLIEIFEEIENETDFHFAYSRTRIKSRVVELDKQSWQMGDLLRSISVQAKVSFKRVNDQIGVSNAEYAEELPHIIEEIEAQEVIEGTVLDENGEPLPGASISEKGTSTGTITDLNGKFQLNVSEGVVLVVSFVGYKSQEIEINNQTSLNITLEPDLASLEEVVVVGYGTKQKGTLTSAVSVVKGDEIKKSPVADVSNTLSGRAAGLIVRNFNAEPGEDASSILVRGVSTTGDNNPLVVVDGIPGRDLSLIDINDIESVTVLKDASAVAPFGSRGANGVLLITTRRGKKGKPTINFRTYTGISKPTRLPQFASSADYALMFNEASRNEGRPEPFTADDIAKYESGTDPNFPNTNWWDEIIQSDPIQSQHNLSVSGAADNLSYYLSLGAFRQDGYFDRANFRKYNFRANIDADVTRDLKVSFDLMGYTDKKNSPGNGGGNATVALLEGPMRIPNTWPVRTPDGSGYVKPTQSNNPLAELNLGGSSLRRSNNFNGTLSLEYSPVFLDGLILRARGVHDNGVSHRKSWLTPYTYYTMVDRANGLYQETIPSTNPSLYEISNFNTQQQLEFHAEYNTTIAQDHNLGALLVYNRTEWRNNYLDGRRINYASASIDQLFAGSPDGQSTNGSAFEGARLGYVGRLTYDYKAKYMVEANFRYDGSMKFAEGNRWGFFPSFALGWRLSEESFIKNNISFINNLKLRGSWGKAGNDRVGDFQFLATYAMQNTPYVLGGTTVQAAKESRLPNPDITWETAILTDFGIEGSMWNDLLSFEVDYFFKRTEDILRPTQKTSSIIGIALPDANIGVVENKGIEFTLGHRNKIGDLGYNIGIVYTYATNEAIELGEAEGTLNDPYRRQTGNPLNSFYGAVDLGLFTSETEIAESPSQGGGIAPGDVKYKDFNGPDGVPDGVVDAYDVTKIGYSTIPEIIYGINIGADYKGFDLTLNFQGAAHVNYIFRDYAGFAFYNGGNIQKWQMEERWTEETNDPNAQYPTLTTSTIGNNTMNSTYWLRDGTYLRLKTIQLGYTINKSFLSKFNIEGLKFYVSGQNIFTWVKDDLFKFDPEAYHQWGQFYPQAKVYTAGLNLTF